MPIKFQNPDESIFKYINPITYKNERTKVYKFVFKDNNIKNPDKTFNMFEKTVTQLSKNKSKVDKSSFLALLNELVYTFKKNNQLDFINNHGKRLAESLVSLGNGEISAIIYSTLIKLNINNPRQIKHLATNGLILAKRMHDPVHIMSRCENLRQIYKIEAPHSREMLKILRTEKKALQEISTNYDKVKNRYKTVSRKMKPQDNYKMMLCAIKIELAKILKDESPKEALFELKSAYSDISQLGDGKFTKEINKLMKEIESKQNKLI